MVGLGNMLNEAQGTVQLNETPGVSVTRFINMKAEVAYDNIIRWNGLIREESAAIIQEVRYSQFVFRPWGEQYTHTRCIICLPLVKQTSM